MVKEKTLLEALSIGVARGALNYIVDTSSLPLGLKKFLFNYVNAGLPNFKEKFSDPGLQLTFKKKIPQINLKSKDLGAFVIELLEEPKFGLFSFRDVINYFSSLKINKIYYLDKGKKYDIRPYSQTESLLYALSGQTRNISN